MSSPPTASPAVDLDGLPPPGTPLFLPSILAQLRVLAPSLAIDPVVLHAILLGVIAGGRNVILQTKEEDVQAVARLTALTLATVFGYPTHRTKFAPEAKHHPPDTIVHALFVPSPVLSASPAGTLSPTSPSASLSPFSSVSAISGGTLRGTGTGAGTALQAHHRSLSRGSTIRPTVPIPIPGPVRPPSAGYAGDVAPSPSTSPTTAAGSVRAPSTRSTAGPGPGAVPTIAYSSSSTHTSVPAMLRPAHSHSAPHAHVRTRTASTANSHSGMGAGAGGGRFGMPLLPLPAELPKAVVVSGLEHTGIAAQRDVVRALRTRELVFEIVDEESGDRQKERRKLPEGFMVVYVCRSDARERPAIFKSLLDYFALSTTVTLQPSTRTALRHRHPSTNTPPLAHPSPRSPAASQSLPQPFLLPATPPVHIHLATTPPAESSAGQAHHRSSLSTSTSGTSPISAAPLANVHPGYPTASSSAPSTPQALLAPGLLDTLRALTTRAHIHAPLGLYLADLLSATRHTAELDGGLLTARCRADVEALARAARVLGADTGRGELVRPPPGIGPDDASFAESGTENGSQSQSTESFFTGEAVAFDGDGDRDGNMEEWAHLNGNGRAMPSPPTPSLRSHRTRDTTASGASARSSQLSRDELEALRLDVAEADIARVFPRAVTHRVRVRASPGDEVLSSAMCGAVGGIVVEVDGMRREVRADDPDAWVRPAVKEVLVRVLADV